MKKRTVKDFIALYSSEDEEKLVLIQDGVSADKTFLDTYWAAHTHALAMADVQTEQVVSGRCYLSWPLTDKERDAGDYSKRFTKGQIYRIKARGWKGDALYEPCLLYTSLRSTAFRHGAVGFHEPLAPFKPKIPLLTADQAGEAVTFSA